jgi:ketosteroid isomerase-like protein
MSEFTRTKQEVRAVMDRFIETSGRADKTGNWSPLADFFAEDAVYQYSMGAGGMRVARGRAEIRRLVMERDMQGFAGWKFPYEWVMIDGDKVITKWWNQAPANREDGTPYRVLGNSNIRFNNDLEIVEMHDNFDLAALIAMVQMLNRKGLTKIHIPDPEESENL